MTVESFTTTNYESQSQQVSWRGVSMADCDEFDSFMTDNVASRLHDAEGGGEFETHLRGLATTGFAHDSLSEILSAEVPEERDWAVGEALAEAYLSEEHGVTWPWNMERDKRTPKASLPGADLVGFEIEGEDIRLALGEVKTSSDTKTPPNVMNGRSGMVYQLDNLVADLGLICQLLKWLQPRCKGTEYESSFNTAIALFLESGNKSVALFGVLIRDAQPNENDLRTKGQALAKNLESPATCQLIAIYLPCTIEDLPDRISGGGS